jgi:hypothetical protein
MSTESLEQVPGMPVPLVARVAEAVTVFTGEPEPDGVVAEGLALAAIDDAFPAEENENRPAPARLSASLRSSPSQVSRLTRAWGNGRASRPMLISRPKGFPVCGYSRPTSAIGVVIRMAQPVPGPLGCFR